MVTTKSKADMTKVWRAFKRTRTETLRNALMENYLSVVKYNADRIRSKLPQEVDSDDLMSAGVFGLMDAIDAYDLERGVKFETYCAPRIRGAILDELRSMDWVPRLVRSRAHKLDIAQRELRAIYGREATDAEIAEHLDMPSKEYEKLRKAGRAVSQVSLSRKFSESDSNRDICEIDVIVDKRGRDPVREAQKKDMINLLTRGFSRAERLILILYYYEEMTMKEIGSTLDLSESRVSQMHSAIIDRLKAHLADRRKEFSHA